MKESEDALEQSDHVPEEFSDLRPRERRLAIEKWEEKYRALEQEWPSLSEENGRIAIRVGLLEAAGRRLLRVASFGWCAFALFGAALGLMIWYLIVVASVSVLIAARMFWSFLVIQRRADKVYRYPKGGMANLRSQRNLALSKQAYDAGADTE